MSKEQATAGREETAAPASGDGGGRGPGGKFAPGNRIGKGRNALKWARAKVFDEELKDDDWRAICRKAIDDAKGGDKSAREWCTMMGVGDPAELQEEKRGGGNLVVYMGPRAGAAPTVLNGPRTSSTS